MATNLSPPILPISPSKTHRFELFTASPASSKTNFSRRPSRAPRVLMALSPLEKHNLLSFSFFPSDVLIKTKTPQNPSSSSSPTPSAFNFDADDNTASDLKTGEPASDLPSSRDVDSAAPQCLSSPPPPPDFNLGSDTGDSCNLKPVNPGSDPLQSDMRTPQYPQPPSV